MRALTSLALACFLLVGTAQAGPTLVEPTGTVRATKKPRWGLFGGGLTLFLTGYAANLGISYGVSNPSASHALIPLIGPLVQMGDRWGLQMAPVNTGNPQVDKMITTQAAQVNGTIQNVAYVVLSVDFAMQAAGLVMAIVGGTTKTWSLQPGPTGSTTLAVRF